jgi:hypothetical protein
MELLFENIAKTASIFFYPEADMGRLKLAGKIETDDFKIAYDKLLEYAIEKKLHMSLALWAYLEVKSKSSFLKL